MEIHSICVCGAGTMGSGIAQATAQAGFATILYELNPAVLEKARSAIERTLQQLKDKGKITGEQLQKTAQLIRYTDEIRDCQADIFIEAIVEKPDVKAALFNQLAGLNRSDAVFASNTSSLSLTTIAKNVQHPERVIGMHFFNPAPVMKLVEVVNTPFTNARTTALVTELVRQLHKVPVSCTDSPGFIVNRVARPYYLEALRLVEEGHTDFVRLDRLLEAAGFKMGPFKLMDLIGNDINYAVSSSIWEQLNRPERLKPSFIQEEKLRSGRLGKKSGEGYYKYN